MCPGLKQEVPPPNSHMVEQAFLTCGMLMLKHLALENNLL